MTEWKVLRNGLIWTDRIKSEDWAYEHIKECVEKGDCDESEFTVEEMIEDEIIESYYPMNDYCDYCLIERQNRHMNGYNFEDAKYCRMCGKYLKGE